MSALETTLFMVAPGPAWKVDDEILQSFHDDMYTKMVETEHTIRELERRAIAYRFAVPKPDATEVTYVLQRGASNRSTTNLAESTVTLQSISYVVEDGLSITVDSSEEGMEGFRGVICQTLSDRSIRHLLRGQTEPVVETVNFAQYPEFEYTATANILNLNQAEKSLTFLERKVMQAEQLAVAMMLPSLGLELTWFEVFLADDYTTAVANLQHMSHPEVQDALQCLNRASRAEIETAVDARVLELVTTMLPVSANYHATVNGSALSIDVKSRLSDRSPEFNDFEYTNYMLS